MTLTIELSPHAERQLHERAADQGLEPSHLAALLVEHGQLPADLEQRRAATAAKSLQQLFAQWEAEDPVQGPDDLRQRQQEFEEFKAGMNAASLSGRPIYP